MSVLGHTNELASDVTRTGRYPGALTVLPDAGPYKREHVLNETPEGGLEVEVEEGIVIDGAPQRRTSYLERRDAKGKVLQRVIRAHEAGDRPRPAETTVKTVIGRIWARVQKVLESKGPGASQGNGFTGIRG